MDKAPGEELASSLSKKRKREVVDSLANGEKEEEKIEKLGDSKPETEGDALGAPQGKKAKVTHTIAPQFWVNIELMLIFV